MLLRTGGSVRRCRVLVADQHDLWRGYTVAKFVLFGADVRQAVDGLEAMVLAYAEPFDIIVLDADLPDCPMAEAMAAIRSEPSRSRGAVVACQRAASVRAALAAGFDRGLERPARASELMDLYARAQTRMDMARLAATVAGMVGEVGGAVGAAGGGVVQSDGGGATSPGLRPDTGQA